MAFYDGFGSNGLAVIVDVRSQHCMEDGQVLHQWALGRRALGRNAWAQTMKIALREHGSTPWTAKQVKENKAEVEAALIEAKISCVILVQTPNIPNVRQVHSAWNMFGAPGNPYKWAGTIMRAQHFYVAPILHPGNYEYVYGWLLERWVRQAAAVAKGILGPMPWPKAIIFPCETMRLVLQKMHEAKTPLAVDIETNMGGTIITAIGFSNECGTVSMPWHEYTIAGTNGETEPALVSYKGGHAFAQAATQILEDKAVPKILHNGSFDVVQLSKHGIALGGFDYDTLLLHRVCYPQYRHALQQALATEICCEPWKSIFKPNKVARGEDVWLGEPVALRTYNGQDCYACWQLYKSLMRKLG